MSRPDMPAILTLEPGLDEHDTKARNNSAFPPPGNRRPGRGSASARVPNQHSSASFSRRGTTVFLYILSFNIFIRLSLDIILNIEQHTIVVEIRCRLAHIYRNTAIQRCGKFYFYVICERCDRDSLGGCNVSCGCR